MNGTRSWTYLVLMAFLAAVLFASDRYIHYASAHDAFDSAVADLESARQLHRRYRAAFEEKKAKGPQISLKSLVQTQCQTHGVNLTYITEIEKDLGKDVRERNVVTRFAHVQHDSLVRLLLAIESNGSDVRIKEVQLKPSNTVTGVYGAAECVVVQRSSMAPNER